MSKQATINPDSLGGIALFFDLTADQIQSLCGLLRCKIFPAGKTIINADQPGEAIYFILDGTVKVHLEQADAADGVVSILGAGDSIGERSLLDNRSRSAGVFSTM